MHKNTTTRATLATTTTAAGRWQDVLEALAAATTVDDAEAAVDAAHEAAYSAGYNTAHEVPALAKVLDEMQDALDEIREEQRIELARVLEDEYEEDGDALDLPTGWDVRIESGHFTGAAVARIFDNTGEERQTLAYWDGWDDLAATAWELYELDNTRSGVHFRALAAEMDRATR